MTRVTESFVFFFDNKDENNRVYVWLLSMEDFDHYRVGGIENIWYYYSINFTLSRFVKLIIVDIIVFSKSWKRLYIIYNNIEEWLFEIVDNYDLVKLKVYHILKIIIMNNKAVWQEAWLIRSLPYFNEH